MIDEFPAVTRLMLEAVAMALTSPAANKPLPETLKDLTGARIAGPEGV
jgi:hypothetical protein